MIQNDDSKKDFGENSIEEQIASLILPSSLENSPRSSKPHTNGCAENNTMKRSNFLSLGKLFFMSRSGQVRFFMSRSLINYR